MENRRDDQEIACQQVLVEDSSVFSIQWSTFPAAITSGLTLRHLLNRYLAYIRSATLSIIRPYESAAGIEFRLLGSRLSLISFQPAIIETADETSGFTLLRICGGILVQPRQCERGEFRFSIEPVQDGVQVSLQLSDFCPLILGGPSPSPVRRLLYQLTQAAIHRLVTIRFLVLLYRDLAGRSSAVRVVNVKVRDGQPV
jgi:hypothetical protein